MGLNLYAYCGNNPVSYYDPSGYSKKKKTVNRTICEFETINGDAGQDRGKTIQDNENTLKINQLPLAKPGEDLYVGTYGKSSYWNKKSGLKTTHTPHHVIQDAVSANSHGKGITINLRKDIHLQTETYGSKRTGLTNRQNLASDILEL